MKRINIAIDISPLKNANRFRGVGSYTRNLVTSLEKVIRNNPSFSGWQIKLIENPQKSAGSFDLIHFPYFDPFFATLPPKKKTIAVVSVHDLIPLRFPQHHPAGIRGTWRWWGQKRRLRSVDSIITISQASRKDIARIINYPLEKIKVTYLAADVRFKPTDNLKRRAGIQKKYSLPSKFVLYVGDVNWNKNVPGLVRACQKNKIPLVIAGQKAVSQDYDRNHIENQDLVWLQQEAKRDSSLHLLGFVPDEDMPLLYSLAALYCQPSFYEGFGLSVVEAMACGCPVVTSNQGSLPEVGGEAVVYCRPYQKASLASAIARVAGDKRLAQQLARKGQLQAKQFSWEKCAQETLAVYQKLLCS